MKNKTRYKFNSLIPIIVANQSIKRHNHYQEKKIKCSESKIISADSLSTQIHVTQTTANIQRSTTFIQLVQNNRDCYFKSVQCHHFIQIQVTIQLITEGITTI